MSEENIQLLDATGLICPEPVMLLHKAVRQMQSGERLRMTATDPSTQRDVLKFCEFLGHGLIEELENEGVFTYLIEKG